MLVQAGARAALRAQIGRGVVRRGGKDVALVGYGTMVNSALAAAELLAQSGVSATVADMRCAFCLSPLRCIFSKGTLGTLANGALPPVVALCACIL
jgi:deoxyxylulose-5-phosphate synthase